MQQQQQQQQQLVRVPRGSVLCICPIESHHDSRLFPGDPWRFDPDRPGVQGLQPGTVVPSLAGMGYGGGFWRCPGRFFAEMELALFVQLVLLQLRLTPTQAAAAEPARPVAAAQQQQLRKEQQGIHLTVQVQLEAAAGSKRCRGACRTCSCLG
ncbi:hypothetical protein COO60DRAFT_275824 [Scenedesmus sp. NREL 46B-D3]|nr:hypothetical protein COO60DRAFT_275824 [Scenedesmus sp. NREL 46B-D3]